MSDQRACDNVLHPRLSVTFVDALRRGSVLDSVADAAAVVDTDSLERRIAELFAARRDERAEHVRAEQARMATLRAERDASAAGLGDLLAERSRLVDAAEWCRREPEVEARSVQRETELGEELDRQTDAAREANHRLERVLEQREASDRALAEARRQLDELGVTGEDENGVRRQLEEASSAVRLASAEYRAAMVDLDRRRASLEDLERRAGTISDDSPVPATSGDNQLERMRAALAAKLRAEDDPVPVVSSVEAADTARVAVADAEAHAATAAEGLAAARARIANFEQELMRRTEDEGGVDARRQAALALEAQVAALEQRLGEAEATAREDIERSARRLIRAEEELERLLGERRDRRRRLVGLAASVSAAGVPAPDVGVAPHVAIALLADASALDADIEHARRTVEDLDRQLAALEAELAAHEEADGRAPAVDRRDALAELAATVAPVVVLDHLVDGPHAPLTCADLDHLDIPVPVVVLTGDADVLGWAIELPADAGQVVPVDVLVDATTFFLDPGPNPDLTRITMECSP